MVEKTTTTEQTVTTSQPAPAVPATTERTVSTTTQTQPAAAPESININAPSGTDAGVTSINVPPAGGTVTTTTTTPDVNVNNP